MNQHHLKSVNKTSEESNDGMDTVPNEFREQKTEPRIAPKLYLSKTRRIDKLRRDLKLPQYAIPSAAKMRFPKLDELLLEAKFPHLADMEATNGLYYTRGKPGHQVLEPNGLKFTLEDEYNQHKVPKMSSYDPLHDLHLERYLNRPMIKQHLVNQGFLKDDLVVCNLKRFNEFRKCSGAAQNAQLAEVLKKEHEHDVEQNQSLREMKSMGGWRIDGSLQGRENAVANKKLHEAFVREKFLDVFRVHEERRQQADRIRAQIRDDMTNCPVCRENQRRVIYDRAKLPQIDKRRNIIMHILRKEEMAELRRKHNRITMRKFQKLKNLHKIQRKINSQLRDQGQMEKVQQILEQRRTEKVSKIGQKMKKKWKDLPEVIARRKAESVRLLNLAQKYFHRWLSKVRQRLQVRREAEVDHMSQWNVTGSMDDVNNEICNGRVKIFNLKTLIDEASRRTAIDRASAVEHSTNDEIAHQEEENSLLNLQTVDHQTNLDEEGFQPDTANDKNKENMDELSSDGSETLSQSGYESDAESSGESNGESDGGSDSTT